MERKFKTKDQKKIERLEEKLAETEAELSNVKKDRKRLNYAVERLEKEKQRILDKVSSFPIQSTPTAQTSAPITPPQQMQQSNTEYRKYALTMLWDVGKAPEWFIQKMDEAIQLGCLTKIGEDDFDNFYEIERTAYYLYEGTLREFEAVKRIVVAMNFALIPIEGRNFRIGLAGGEIFDYELEKLSKKH